MRTERAFEQKATKETKGKRGRRACSFVRDFNAGDSLKSRTNEHAVFHRSAGRFDGLIPDEYPKSNHALPHSPSLPSLSSVQYLIGLLANFPLAPNKCMM